MFQYKVYLYDSTKTDYRGTEYTDYVLQGAENVEDLTEELDTSSLTLVKFNKSAPFDPSTKFIIDVVEDGEVVETLHRIVSQDTVDQEILGDTTHFKHSISLIEPSAIAQQRMVDNIAVTYKLKDVTLATQTTLDTTRTIPFEYRSTKTTANLNFTDLHMEKYFVYIDGLKAINPNSPSVGRDTYYLLDTDYEESGTSKVAFKIPHLEVWMGQYGTKNFLAIGFASLHYKITKYHNNEPTYYEGDIISNSDFASGQSGYSYASSLPAGYIYETAVAYDSRIPTDFYVRKYSDPTASSASYVTSYVPFEQDDVFIVEVSLKDFDSEVLSTHFTAVSTIYTFAMPIRDTTDLSGRYNLKLCTIASDKIKSESRLEAYHTNAIQEVYQSGTAYSALMLLYKAIQNTEVRAKQSGIATFDYNHRNSSNQLDYNSPFYIDSAYINMLENTDVVESFFQGKNLWEVLIEVGHYIHAIPSIKFGDNDKLLITFDLLGETEQSTDDAQRMSIRNFRGLDDYIAETNSYVSNLVQLGGYIEEWVVPKTTSDDYMVYNDYACIEVSKPIIELIGLQIKCMTTQDSSVGISAGDVTSLSGSGKNNALNYIFESNVYNVLSIEYLDFPNKGISMYYNLGEKQIIGGNYQLPRENSDLYSDYSFKKLIWCAFHNQYPSTLDGATTGYWKDIRLVDFAFKVIYRTKDTARVSHTRPDLRKYLRASKFDVKPYHAQFNQQQDNLIDSTKFGLNVYGTLIRTGNNTYTIREWCKTWGEVKRKGDLITINSELYYCSKVTTELYATHIVCDVEYTKDYNQLSKIIGIPSEPRFYEISEQSSVLREVNIDEFLCVSTVREAMFESTNRIANITPIAQLVFGSSSAPSLPRYAITTFKGDGNVNANEGTIGDKTLAVDIISPLNMYAVGTTLTFEWDMVDNYSAGNRNNLTDSTKYTDYGAYESLQAVRYTDKYGKATLFDFYLIGDQTFTASQMKAFPVSPFNSRSYINNGNTYIGDLNNAYIISPSSEFTSDSDFHNDGLILVKDNRESISMNYNLQVLSTSDQFVFSPYFFEEKKNESGTSNVQCKLVLLREEVNKLSGGFVKTSDVLSINNVKEYAITLAYLQDVDIYGNSRNNVAELMLGTSLASVPATYFTSGDIKAIALVFNFNENSTLTKFALARNIPTGTSKSDACATWYLGLCNRTTLFTNKQ